jgi:hypothetical protein
MGPKITYWGVAVLAFCAGTAVSFFTLPVWVAFVINLAKDGGRSDWIGFAGNVFAGVVTLIAAIVAWFAVQQQIRSQEQVAEAARAVQEQHREKSEADAKRAARLVLAPAVHATATALYIANRIDELANIPEIKSNDVRILEAAERFEKMMRVLKSIISHFAVAEVWHGLEIGDKTTYLIVVATMHTIVTLEENPAHDDRVSWIRSERSALVDLRKYLRGFDEDLADVFDDFAGVKTQGPTLSH